MSYLAQKVVLIVLVVCIFGVLLYTLAPKGKSGPGSCEILEEKYCKQLVLLDNPALPGAKIAAAKLPTGTPLFSVENTDGKLIVLDRSGTTSIDNGKSWNTVVTISLPPDKSCCTYAYIYYFPKSASSGSIVAKGKQIGAVTDKKAIFKNYNFVFAIYAKDPKEATGILRAIVKK